MHYQGCPDTAKSSRYNHSYQVDVCVIRCPDTAKSSRYNRGGGNEQIGFALSWYRQILSV